MEGFGYDPAPGIVEPLIDTDLSPEMPEEMSVLPRPAVAPPRFQFEGLPRKYRAKAAYEIARLKQESADRDADSVIQGTYLQDLRAELSQTEQGREALRRQMEVQAPRMPNAMPTVNTGEGLAALLAGLLGGDWNQASRNAMAQAGAREGRAYEQDATDFERSQKLLGLDYGEAADKEDQLRRLIQQFQLAQEGRAFDAGEAEKDRAFRERMESEANRFRETPEEREANRKRATAESGYYRFYNAQPPKDEQSARARLSTLDRLAVEAGFEPLTEDERKAILDQGRRQEGYAEARRKMQVTPQNPFGMFTPVQYEKTAAELAGARAELESASRSGDRNAYDDAERRVSRLEGELEYMSGKVMVPNAPAGTSLQPSDPDALLPPLPDRTVPGMSGSIGGGRRPPRPAEKPKAGSSNTPSVKVQKAYAGYKAMHQKAWDRYEKALELYWKLTPEQRNDKANIAKVTSLDPDNAEYLRSAEKQLVEANAESAAFGGPQAKPLGPRFAKPDFSKGAAFGLDVLDAIMRGVGGVKANPKAVVKPSTKKPAAQPKAGTVQGKTGAVKWRFK